MALGGELDLDTGEELEQAIEAIEADEPATLVIDLSGLEFIDSTGIRVLLQTNARWEERAGELRIRRAPAHIHRVFTLANLDGALPFVD